MKRSELKRIIKPLVKDCIREVLLEEGLLSGIISEVAKGLNGTIIKEEKVVEKPIFRQEQPEMKSNRLTENRKKLMDAIGKDAYKGVDLFEGTTPAPAQQNPESVASNPLSNIDPGDSGVDISGILSLGGKNWKALMG